MIDRLLAAVRRVLPTTERQRWRREMADSRDAARREAARLRANRIEAAYLRRRLGEESQDG